MTQKIQPQWVDNTTGMLTTFENWMAMSRCMYTITTDTTAVGNSGAGEDDLITFTLPAARMSDNGDYIKITAWGTLAANVNSKQVKLKFGGTTLYDSTAQIQSGWSWLFEAMVVRTGASTQKALAKATYDNVVTLYTNELTLTNPAETLSWTVIIKCTGEWVASDDISQEWLIVTYFTAV